MPEDEIEQPSDDHALVPLTTDAEVTPALRAVYEGIPGEVVNLCESHRMLASTAYLRHMQIVRNALAPYGRFKEWCLAAGISYASLMSRFNYAANSKHWVANSATARSVQITQETTPILPGGAGSVSPYLPPPMPVMHPPIPYVFDASMVPTIDADLMPPTHRNRLLTVLEDLRASNAPLADDQDWQATVALLEWARDRLISEHQDDPKEAH
jgi:hypothetical protein